MPWVDPVTRATLPARDMVLFLCLASVKEKRTETERERARRNRRLCEKAASPSSHYHLFFSRLRASSNTDKHSPPLTMRLSFLALATLAGVAAAREMPADAPVRFAATDFCFYVFFFFWSESVRGSEGSVRRRPTAFVEAPSLIPSRCCLAKTAGRSMRW
jgi:hypothetical protein